MTNFDADKITPLFGMDWVLSLLRACREINENKPEHQMWIDEASRVLEAAGRVDNVQRAIALMKHSSELRYIKVIHLLEALPSDHPSGAYRPSTTSEPDKFITEDYPNMEDNMTDPQELTEERIKELKKIFILIDTCAPAFMCPQKDYADLLSLLDAALANQKKDEWKPISEEAASLMDTTAGGRATADLVSAPVPQPEQSVGQEERVAFIEKIRKALDAALFYLQGDYEGLQKKYHITGEYREADVVAMIQQTLPKINLILSPPAPRKVSRESLAEAVISYQITGPHSPFILVDDIQRFLHRLGLEVEDGR